MPQMQTFRRHRPLVIAVYCEPIGGHQMAEYAVAFLRATHLQKNNFHRLRGQTIDLTLPDGAQPHVNGKLSSSNKLHIEVIPSAVKACVP